MCAKLFQSCLTLCDPIDSSPPGSSVHGIFQVRILERVAMPSSRGSSPPRGQTCISCTDRCVLYHQRHPGSPYMYLARSFSWLSPKGHLLITWLWRSGGQSYRTITIRGTVLGRLPPPNTRHCTDSRRNALIFLRKRSICLSWSFGLRVRLLVWYTSKGREMEYFLLYQ